MIPSRGDTLVINRNSPQGKCDRRGCSRQAVAYAMLIPSDQGTKQESFLCQLHLVRLVAQAAGAGCYVIDGK
jgi:hypothetical protein